MPFGQLMLNKMDRDSGLRDRRLNRLAICILLRLHLALLRILNQAIELVQAGNNISFGENLLKVHAHARAQPICELLVEVSQAIGHLFGGRGKA
jgi:hypothetical protein